MPNSMEYQIGSEHTLDVRFRRIKYHYADVIEGVWRKEKLGYIIGITGNDMWVVGEFIGRLIGRFTRMVSGLRFELRCMKESPQ